VLALLVAVSDLQYFKPLDPAVDMLNQHSEF
jgi:hypothetical protein